MPWPDDTPCTRLDAVTTRALARKLGVSHAAPARHFPNRGALLAEVAADAFERFAHALGRAAKPHPAKAAFVAMGRAYVRFALEHPGLLNLMFSPEIKNLTAPNERLEAAATHAYQVLQAGRVARSATRRRKRTWLPQHFSVGPWRTAPPRSGSMARSKTWALEREPKRTSSPKRIALSKPWRARCAAATSLALPA